MRIDDHYRDLIPEFGLEVPRGYSWLLEKMLIGFEPFTQFEPWYYLSRREYIEISNLWPEGDMSASLFAFAKRQDSDVIACFHETRHRTEEVVVIEGWTGNGYDVVCTYPTFWDWVKSVIDDIAEWVDLANPPE